MVARVVEAMQSFPSKSELRKQALLKRDSLPEKKAEEASQAICKALIEVAKGYDIIYAYYPFRSEVDILPFIKSVLEGGKQIYLPVVLSKIEMEFRRLADLNHLKQGAYRIMEPVGGKIATFEKAGLMLTPGAAFSENLFRMGYGAGYYDRLLESKKCSNIFKIGVAFEVQIYPTIPTEAHDVRLDLVITEERRIENK